METERKIDDPFFIDTIAGTHKAVARMLAPLEPQKRFEEVRRLFEEAYRAGEDDEASVIFTWVDISERRQVSHSISHLGRCIAAHQLSYMMAPGEGTWPTGHPMPKTNEIMARALAIGMMTSDAEDGEHYYTILHGNFLKNESVRRIILDALKGVTGKGSNKERLLKFVGLSSMPEEIRRVFMNAWMRNSDDASLSRTAKLATLLDGCLPSAHKMAGEHLRYIKSFDDHVKRLVAILRGPGQSWVSANDTIDVEYDLSSVGSNWVKLGVVIWERPGYGKSLYASVAKAIADIFSTWRESWTKGRCHLNVSVRATNGHTLLHHFSPTIK